MTDPETARLRKKLEHAQAERREVAEEGEDREPLLQRLEQHLHENGFAERLVHGLIASKRRHA